MQIQQWNKMEICGHIGEEYVKGQYDSFVVTFWECKTLEFSLIRSFKIRFLNEKYFNIVIELSRSSVGVKPADTQASGSSCVCDGWACVTR